MIPSRIKPDNLPAPLSYSRKLGVGFDLASVVELAKYVSKVITQHGVQVELGALYGFNHFLILTRISSTPIGASLYAASTAPRSPQILESFFAHLYLSLGHLPARLPVTLPTRLLFVQGFLNARMSSPCII
jgi:hypothetical protein